MDFVPLLVLLATVKKIVDFVRYARGGDTNAIVVQILAWAAGVALIALTAHTGWAAQIDVGGLTLAQMNAASQVLAGIALGSTASLATDALKATDNTQSAATPPLLPKAAHR